MINIAQRLGEEWMSMLGKEILGVDVDAQGRCAHWHTPVDVVANKCATCGQFYACSICHAELADHPFGAMDKHTDAVLCGVCGETMNYRRYRLATACPACGHPFNPGCHAHEEIYFQLGPVD